jgi:hypothetical protein
MKSVERLIELLEAIEIHTYTQQVVVEIVFDYTGFSFMLISYYQFVIFCTSFFRVVINTLYITMIPFIGEFWTIVPFIGWIFFWYSYIRNLKYIIWLKSLKGKFLNSYFIVHEWPKWRLFLYQYLSYYSYYAKIFKNYVNLQYSSLAVFKIFFKTVEFVHTTFLYIPYAFKFGNRKQTYFRNYFNSKKKHTNWVWKWRK